MLPVSQANVWIVPQNPSHHILDTSIFHYCIQSLVGDFLRSKMQDVCWASNFVWLLSVLQHIHWYVSAKIVLSKILPLIWKLQKVFLYIVHNIQGVFWVFSAQIFNFVFLLGIREWHEAGNFCFQDLSLYHRSYEPPNKHLAWLSLLQVTWTSSMIISNHTFLCSFCSRFYSLCSLD